MYEFKYNSTVRLYELGKTYKSINVYKEYLFNRNFEFLKINYLPWV